MVPGTLWVKERVGRREVGGRAEEGFAGQAKALGFGPESRGKLLPRRAAAKLRDVVTLWMWRCFEAIKHLLMNGKDMKTGKCTELLGLTFRKTHGRYSPWPSACAKVPHTWPQLPFLLLHPSKHRPDPTPRPTPPHTNIHTHTLAPQARCLQRHCPCPPTVNSGIWSFIHSSLHSAGVH